MEHVVAEALSNPHCPREHIYCRYCATTTHKARVKINTVHAHNASISYASLSAVYRP